MKRTLILAALLLASSGTAALMAQRTERTAYSFDFTATKDRDGVIAVTPATRFSDELGYGYDLGTAWNAADRQATAPFFFSVNVPDGNYRVTVTLGSSRRASVTELRAENRRLFVENAPVAKGKTETFTFVVNKRSPAFTRPDGKTDRVKLKPRELGYLNWDDKLTFEFNGEAPALRSLTIERDDTVPTLFLCGNSTVVDQSTEPYASWGQMVTRWFGADVAVSNHAESGLTARTFIGGNRLDKILSMMKPGDWVVCEFGHNDEKEHRPGDGAWYHYQYQLKIFIDEVRKAGGHITFCTPTQRRNFGADRQHIEPTHGDFPAAMREVARREDVPLVELNEMTNTFFEALGFEDSKKSLVHYPAGTFPGQDQALADNTHFNPYGAYEVAKMVIMGWKELGLPMAQWLRPEWQDFDPAHPDAPDAFVWPLCPIVDTTKPDGN